MKLIIDIPEESYEYIQTMSDQGWLTFPEYVNVIRLTSSEYANVIKNATPLDELRNKIDKVYDNLDRFDPNALRTSEIMVNDILNDIENKESEK